MSQIVTWEFYNSLYDKVTQTEFAKYEPQAEAEVKAVIGLRYDNITEQTYGYDQLKHCICKVINQLFDCDNSGAGKGVTSVSNDGYSESYSVVTHEQMQNEMRTLIRSSLSGTGLVGAY